MVRSLNRILKRGTRIFHSDYQMIVENAATAKSSCSATAQPGHLEGAATAKFRFPTTAQAGHLDRAATIYLLYQGLEILHHQILEC